ncbi:hypothetical protein Adu01nite_43890 [Paractinoplanes durhamensis]|uniref:Signal peptidase I n=1 Tax=Paractinoplanes durhamensis TaxID=113563 RepID=A0ABQ3YZS7_9ACTN|nr:hypothetical protein Adu01nite_43890 [Actinoplanes durhamensis]
MLIGAAGVFLLRYRVYQVPTTSMTPAIEPGNRIVVDTWSRTTHRGDMVLVTGEGTDLVKRVAATGGEVAACCDPSGHLQMDGVPLALTPSGDEPFSVRVPAGHLFLLGDNLTASVDSRATGTVPSSDVLGRVVALAYPARLFPDRAAGTLRLVVLAGLLGLSSVLLAALLTPLARGHSNQDPRTPGKPRPTS